MCGRGCCGCSLKASTTTAGIFGLVQGIIALCLNVHFLKIYKGEIRDITAIDLVLKTSEYIGTIKTLLIISITINCIWILSSICLLYGNNAGKSSLVRQWVIFTAAAVLAVENVILPTVLGFKTFGSLVEERSYGNIYGTDRDRFYGSGYSETVGKRVTLYCLMVAGFGPGGMITFICNICLCVYANRRVDEIDHSIDQISITQGPISIHPGYSQQVIYTDQPMGPQIQPIVHYNSGQPATAYYTQMQPQYTNQAPTAPYNNPPYNQVMGPYNEPMQMPYPQPHDGQNYNPPNQMALMQPPIGYNKQPFSSNDNQPPPASHERF